VHVIPRVMGPVRRYGGRGEHGLPLAPKFCLRESETMQLVLGSERAVFEKPEVLGQHMKPFILKWCLDEEILGKRIFLQYVEALRSRKTTEPIHSRFLCLYSLHHTEPHHHTKPISLQLHGHHHARPQAHPSRLPPQPCSMRMAAAWSSTHDVKKALLARARDAYMAWSKLDDLHRALEHAVEEANVAVELLELPTTKNAGLPDAVAKKESAFEVVQCKLSTAVFLDSGRVVGMGWKERMFASLSYLTELKSVAAAVAAMDDYSYKFDHFNVEKGFDIMPLIVSQTCGPRLLCH
jgi:hypothetical protein